MATLFEIQDALRGLNIKELREQCRARGLNPAGEQEKVMPPRSGKNPKHATFG
jgi:hypothetical protein